MRGCMVKATVAMAKMAKTKSETAARDPVQPSRRRQRDLAAFQLSSTTTKKVERKAVTSCKRNRLTSALPPCQMRSTR